MSRNWELMHALTMLVSFAIQGDTQHLNAQRVYHVFCIVSFMYHMSRVIGATPRTIKMLQTLDMASQIIACIPWAKKPLFLYTMLFVSFFVNFHMKLLINASCILYVSNNYWWHIMIVCAIIKRTTNQHMYHSLMHVIGHIAFYNQQTPRNILQLPTTSTFQRP